MRTHSNYKTVTTSIIASYVPSASSHDLLRRSAQSSSASELIQSIEQQCQQLASKQAQLAKSEVLLNRRHILLAEIEDLLRERTHIQNDIVRTRQRTNHLSELQFRAQHKTSGRQKWVSHEAVQVQRLRTTNQSLRQSAKSLKEYASNLETKNAELAEKVHRRVFAPSTTKQRSVLKKSIHSSEVVSCTTKGADWSRLKEKFRQSQQSRLKPARAAIKVTLPLRRVEQSNSRLRHRFAMLRTPQISTFKNK